MNRQREFIHALWWNALCVGKAQLREHVVTTYLLWLVPESRYDVNMYVCVRRIFSEEDDVGPFAAEDVFQRARHPLGQWAEVERLVIG